MIVSSDIKIFAHNITRESTSAVIIALLRSQWSSGYKRWTWSKAYCEVMSQHKKTSNHHANLPLEMYTFTL